MDTEICELSGLTGAASSEPARSISTFLARQTRELGASHYLLLDAGSCIISSNWVYDAVAEVGVPTIAHLAGSSAVIWPGHPMRGYNPLTLAALTERDQIAALAYYGHQEVFALALPTGRKRFLLLLSAGKPDEIAKNALSRAQMLCCYLLSRFVSVAEPPTENPLVRKEIECLSWVARGKTTDEVAVILGISTNTVNSKIAHAIQKLEAKNRAMAIATAIRRKLISTE